MKAVKSATAKAKQLALDHFVTIQTERDFRDALLVVSLVVNIFFVCLWVALQVTSRYDSALTDFFLNR